MCYKFIIPLPNTPHKLNFQINYLILEINSMEFLTFCIS